MHGMLTHMHMRAGVLLRELQRLRFVEPEEALVIVQARNMRVAEQQHETRSTFRMWTVDESIWKPRKRQFFRGRVRVRARSGSGSGSGSGLVLR